MKFNDVIVKEDLGDWMFGDRAKRGGDNPKATSNAPGMSGTTSGSGISKKDKMAYGIFVDDFISDAVTTIKAGLAGGLIAPPAGAPGKETGDEPEGSDGGENNDVRKNKDGKNYLMPGFQEKARRMWNPKMTGHMQYGEYVPNKSDYGKETDGFNNVKSPLKRKKKWQQFTLQQMKDKGLTTQEIQRAYPGFTGDMNEWVKLVNMNYILESIITEEETQTGQPLHKFLQQWFGQWMTGVNVSVATRKSLDAVMMELQKAYDASPNPQKPIIDRNILKKLANGSWSASGAQGGDYNAAKGMDNARKIDNTQTVDLTDIPDGATVKLSKEISPGKGRVAVWTKSQQKWYYKGDSSKGSVQGINKGGQELQDVLSKVWSIQNSQRKSKTQPAPGQVSQEEWQASKVPEPSLADAPAEPIVIPQAPEGTQFQNNNLSAIVVDGVWVDSSGSKLNQQSKDDLNAAYIKMPQHFSNISGKDEKDSIAESKTNSALRAEKIPALKTR